MMPKVFNGVPDPQYLIGLRQSQQSIIIEVVDATGKSVPSGTIRSIDDKGRLNLSRYIDPNVAKLAGIAINSEGQLVIS